MTNGQVVRNTEQPTVKLVFELAYSHVGWVHSGPDLSITRLCRPQDPCGPPANCGTHRVSCRYCIWSLP